MPFDADDLADFGVIWYCFFFGGGGGVGEGKEGVKIGEWVFRGLYWYASSLTYECLHTPLVEDLFQSSSNFEGEHPLEKNHYVFCLKASDVLMLCITQS